MATTPNFGWLETLLKNAAGYLRARPDASATSKHLEAVVSARAFFIDTKVHTDQGFLQWRGSFNAAIAAHKQVRRAYDRARTECVEWGLPDFPDHYVTYLEDEKTQRVAEEMLDFLAKVELDDEWVAKAIADVQSALDGAQQAMRKQELELVEYKGVARRRKEAYDFALDVMQAFFDDVKYDLDKDTPEYFQLSPNPIF